jgi:hypothetical protein
MLASIDNGVPQGTIYRFANAAGAINENLPLTSEIVELNNTTLST